MQTMQTHISFLPPPKKPKYIYIYIYINAHSLSCLLPCSSTSFSLELKSQQLILLLIEGILGATDIEGGSRFGYKLLWVLLMSNAMALLLQTLAARLGLVSGMDLAQACRKEYPRLVTTIFLSLSPHTHTQTQTHSDLYIRWLLQFHCYFPKIYHNIYI